MQVSLQFDSDYCLGFERIVRTCNKVNDTSKYIGKWVRCIFNKAFKLYNNKCESNSALQSAVHIATMSSS